MWEDIIKNQITSGKQGILTSDSTLPKKKKPEDCYPPLYALFVKFLKLQNVLDPGKTLLMNWEHGFTPEELCKLKNKSNGGVTSEMKNEGKYNGTASLSLYLITDENAGKGELMVLFTIYANLHRTHAGLGVAEKNKEDYGIIEFTFMVSTYRNRQEIGEHIHSKIRFDGYPSANSADEIDGFDRSIVSFIKVLEDYQNGIFNPDGLQFMDYFAPTAELIHDLFDYFYPDQEKGDDEQ